MYVHVNRATSVITKCSPAKPRDPKFGWVEVTGELADQLIAGNLGALKDYFVLSHLDGSYTMERYEQVSVLANKRYESTELVEIKVQDDADFKITIDNPAKSIHIKLNRIFNVSATKFVGLKLASEIETCTMYFTKKNDPSYLLFLIELPLDKLLVGENNTITYPLPVACQSVSVYTKQVLNSYSLEIR